jgi:hypothetical protein
MYEVDCIAMGAKSFAPQINDVDSKIAASKMTFFTFTFLLTNPMRLVSRYDLWINLLWHALVCLGFELNVGEYAFPAYLYQ